MRAPRLPSRAPSISAPAATLLVPYFQVSVNSSGNPIGTGALSRDTIVTIGNASSAPMIAHVNVYDRYSTLQLDFNVALTGFDLQSWSMSNILSGNLPITVNAQGRRRLPVATLWRSSIRARMASSASGRDSPATSLDNTAGITKYGSPAFTFPLGKTLATECDGTVDPLAIGYIVIDHANYCTLSDPTDPNYYYNNAIGMENNLFGEIIFTSGNGLPTYGLSTVNLEADSAIGIASNVTPIITPARTFYARYWAGAAYPATICPNCVSAVVGHNLGVTSPWNVPGIYPNVVGIGDQREPLGLRWALRWFDLTASGIITTNFQVWRGSRTVQSRAAFCSKAAPVEPPVALTFWDEDEGTVQTGGCPSPCTSPVFNFDVETQQRNISDYQHPAA